MVVLVATSGQSLNFLFFFASSSSPSSPSSPCTLTCRQLEDVCVNDVQIINKARKLVQTEDGVNIHCLSETETINHRVHNGNLFPVDFTGRFFPIQSQSFVYKTRAPIVSQHWHTPKSVWVTLLSYLSFHVFLYDCMIPVRLHPLSL